MFIFAAFFNLGHLYGGLTFYKAEFWMKVNCCVLYVYCTDASFAMYYSCITIPIMYYCMGLQHEYPLSWFYRNFVFGIISDWFKLTRRNLDIKFYIRFGNGLNNVMVINNLLLWEGLSLCSKVGLWNNYIMWLKRTWYMNLQSYLTVRDQLARSFGVTFSNWFSRKRAYI